jgi:hypothetical protein
MPCIHFLTCLNYQASDFENYNSFLEIHMNINIFNAKYFYLSQFKRQVSCDHVFKASITVINSITAVLLYSKQIKTSIFLSSIFLPHNAESKFLVIILLRHPVLDVRNSTVSLFLWNVQDKYFCIPPFFLSRLTV